MLLPSDLHGTDTKHSSHEILVVFEVKRSKIKVTQVVRILSYPLRGPMSIWPICFICGTNITREVTIRSALFPGQEVKSQCYKGRSKYFSCPLRGSIQPVRGRCVPHNFQVRVNVAQFVLSYNVDILGIRSAAALSSTCYLLLLRSARDTALTD